MPRVETEATTTQLFAGLALVVLPTPSDATKIGQRSTPMTNTPEPLSTFDNCICAEWDGKGWSTCGAPCNVHKPSDREIERVQKARGEFLKNLPNLVADWRAKQAAITKLKSEIEE